MNVFRSRSGSPPVSNSTQFPSALLLHPNDSVAVCVRSLSAGMQLLVAGQSVRAAEDIAAGHKMAIQEHLPGHPVMKYGWPIGVATQRIGVGQQVHCHNLSMTTEGCTSAVQWTPPDRSSIEENFTFDGYVRPNGQVGTRNYVAVISNVNCSASVASMIAGHFTAERLKDFENVDGVISFRHDSGCGMAWEGMRHRTLSRVLAGLARHPNIGACLLVGLGCEQGTLDHLVSSQQLHQIHLTSPAGSQAAGAAPGRGRGDRPAGLAVSQVPLPLLSIQQSGGTQSTVDKGIRMVTELLPQVNSFQRSQVPASKLVLATECGGSDGYSGVTANPVLGAAADLLVACGGTVVLSETPEIFGAEHLLTCRARSPQVAAQLLNKIRWWQQHCSHYGEKLDHNPSVGNKAGGLTTIVEKSLGAVAKAGSTRLEAVVEYAESVGHPGLVFMDTPGYDPASVTGMIAGGANLVAFTTGRGSCFGSKPAPTYKIASNSQLFRSMPEDMDFDAGCVLQGESVQSTGSQLFGKLLEVASGKPTCSEKMGIGDHEFVPWLLGPML